jgi:hypothetical protein
MRGNIRSFPILFDLLEMGCSQVSDLKLILVGRSGTSAHDKDIGWLKVLMKPYKVC